VDTGGPDISTPAPIVILLDTNAVIWAGRKHPRAKRLLSLNSPLYISPVNLLELRFLSETHRIKWAGGTMQSILDDDRWVLDEPPAVSWFLRATDLSWTRDPFDRLLAAHALVRGWRLATSDDVILEHLGASGSFEL
jgi:predicted nucleic acid-binding protein